MINFFPFFFFFFGLTLRFEVIYGHICLREGLTFILRDEFRTGVLASFIVQLMSIGMDRRVRPSLRSLRSVSNVSLRIQVFLVEL